MPGAGERPRPSRSESGDPASSSGPQQHHPKTRRFCPRTRRHTSSWDDKTVEIKIADDGPGFLPDVMDTLGEPYVTTRPAARLGIVDTEPIGMGLGLLHCKDLARALGGDTGHSKNRKLPSGERSCGSHGRARASSRAGQARIAACCRPH